MADSDWIFEFTQSVLSAPKTASVYSISWGYTESEWCSGIAACNQVQAYINACEANLASIAALGITVVVSSGDGGSVGIVADGSWATSCTSSTPLSPMYPATSAYVLSVGATQLSAPTLLGGGPLICSTYNCAAGSGGETACSFATGSGITTGGGFSDYVAQPTWQSSSVSAYLSSGALLPTVAYHATGRAYPDVAAMGHNLLVIMNGSLSVRRCAID